MNFLRIICNISIKNNEKLLGSIILQNNNMNFFETYIIPTYLYSSYNFHIVKYSKRKRINTFLVNRKCLYTGKFLGLESLLYFHIKPGINSTLKVLLSDCFFTLFENKLSIFNKENNVEFVGNKIKFSIFKY